jgi:NYN domain/OST-HTH/LOTUS domain
MTQTHEVNACSLRDDVLVPTTDATRLAVLIDSDNTTASLTTELLEEIAKYGTPTIKRAYAGNLEGFVIVSSDSDFTRLATRLRESGMTVYLIKNHTAFDPRDYGHGKLGELVRTRSYVDVKDVPSATGPSQICVRLKPRAPKRARAR